MKLNKRIITTLCLLFAAYFFTRLSFLTKLPIFTDEAIYIRWGQIGLRDASHRFLSLEDGKQPLFVWFMYPLLKIFTDPLVAGRMVSVIAGFASLIGLMLLAKTLFGKKTVIPVALLYIISPFFLFYDRLALYDSLTCAFAIWALLFEILLVTKLKLEYALLLGFAVGGGLLTKSSAQFSLYLLPVSLLLFNFKKPKLLFRFINWLGLALLVLVISLAFSWIIKLSPLQHMVAQKNLTFILSFSDFLQDPFSRLIGNLRGLTDWLTGYFTWPWIVGLLFSLIPAFKNRFKKTLLLLSWFLFPYIALAAFGIVLYPRFIVFMTFPLLLILAFGFTQLKGKIKSRFFRALCSVLLAGYAFYFSSQIIFNPVNAPLPQADRLQFLDDWPSGYGINEVVEFLRVEAQNQPTFVATEGTFGLTPYALTIYLQDTPNLQIQGYWPISDGMEEILIRAKEQVTYILFKDTQEPRPEWPLELIAQYRKGKGNVFMKLYQVKQ